MNRHRSKAPTRRRRLHGLYGVAVVAATLGALSACAPADPPAAARDEPVADAGAGLPAGHGADLRGVWTNNPRPETREFQNSTFSAAPAPMTDWARALYDQARPTFGAKSVPVAETNDPVYQCFPPGTPRVYLHPFPMEIIQLPGRVLMVFEYDHLIRQIFTDGRGHRDDLAPSWMGDSTGHWEGDTLVVETVNFNDKTWIDREGVPHSEQLRVVERIRRPAPDELTIDLTIEDPVALTVPWVGQRTYGLVDWNIEEFMCMDNVNFTDFEEEILEYGEGAAD
jgi:hypothetical protein